MLPAIASRMTAAGSQELLDRRMRTAPKTVRNASSKSPRRGRPARDAMPRDPASAPTPVTATSAPTPESPSPSTLTASRGTKTLW